MKKEISKNAELLINYGIYSLVICALAGIGFFFNVWEPASVLFLSSIIVFPILWMNLYLYTKPKSVGEPLTAGSIILLSLGRIILLIINIVVSAVLLKFTDGIGGKYRLLYVLLTFVPVALAFGMFYFSSKRNGELEIIPEDVKKEVDEIIDGDEIIDDSEKK